MAIDDSKSLAEEFLAPPPPGWSAMEVRTGAQPRASIGLIALANDCAIEPDLYGYLPLEGVRVQTNRIYSPRHSNLASLRAVAADIGASAQGLMPDDHLDVIAFGCTSATMALGRSAVQDAIEKVKPGIPVTDPITAALKGLRRLGCNRIALLTPYIGEVNLMVEGYLVDQGVEVMTKGFFGVHDDNERSRITPDAFSAAAAALADAQAIEALFISCTALSTSPAVERLEQELGKPVVTSNQALAWDALRLAGDTRPVEGRGQLLRL